MLYKVSTRKEWSGKVAAIVTRCDGFRASYSLHPDRSRAYFHGQKIARDLHRRRKQHIASLVELRDDLRATAQPAVRRYDRLSRYLAIAAIWLVAASFAAPLVRAAL